MLVQSADLIGVLRQYNPWWSGNRFSELPAWKRAAFREIAQWIENPPGGRALLLSGARQVGKTTLFFQTVGELLAQGIPPGNILYATFDHPLLKLAGLEGLLRLWDEIEPSKQGVQYLFLDEIQSIKDWQVWLKHQVDFRKNRRIAVTGSATPLAVEGQESGVGRWHTLRLATLSFFEFLQLRKDPLPDLPKVPSLAALFDMDQVWFTKTSIDAGNLTGLFHEYLLRGGFPQTATVSSVQLAQKLLREDIVDKVLKRDMTALFGVRRILELEQTFLYLCLHDGGMLDMQELSKNLEVRKTTALSFISLLEATHLIYRLMPFGYGKEILRGKPKIYLADPAIAPGVLLKGKSLLENPTLLGQAAETAFFKHVFSRYYARSISFSYWRGGKKGLEVDIIADIGGRYVPFEVKYRGNTVETAELKGLTAFCKERNVTKSYVITKNIENFGVLPLTGDKRIQALKIPASLACYWLGESETLPE
jgi:uncharacterized protein